MRQSNARVAFALLGAVSACSPKGRTSSDEGRSPAQAPSAATATTRAPTGSAASAAPPAVSAAEPPPSVRSTPVDASAPRSPPLVGCYAGFAPSAVPRVDVVRLGVACGPSTGLTQLARINGVVDETNAGPTLRWDAARGDCFRLFAVAGAPVEDLEVDVKGPHGSFAALTNQNRRWLVAGEDALFCAAQKGQFEATFSTHAGRGAVAAAVWRGAHMAFTGADRRNRP